MKTTQDQDPTTQYEDEHSHDGTAEDLADINFGRDDWVHPDETRSEAQIESDERLVNALHMSGALDPEEYWQDYYDQFEESWMGDVALELHDTVVESGIETEEDLREHLVSVFKHTANTPAEIYEEDADRVTGELLERHQNAEDPVKSSVGELAFGANKKQSELIENAMKLLSETGESPEQIKQRYEAIISAERSGNEEAGDTRLAAQEIALNTVERDLNSEIDELDDERDDYEDDDDRYEGTAEDLADIEFGMDKWVHPDETSEDPF